MRKFLTLKQIIHSKFYYYHLASFVLLVLFFGGMFAYMFASKGSYFGGGAIGLMMLAWWPDKELIKSMEDNP